ncbi:MAG TPA: hypothetical protein VF077_06230, partial [Nitrospiraceae bacterium]
MENGLVVTGVDLGTDSTLMTLERLVKDVLAGLSEHTRRVYAPHIKRFVQNGYQLNREGLQRWIGDERDKRKTPAAINQGISAVKKLAEECGERGLIGAVEWGGVRSVKRLKQ